MPSFIDYLAGAAAAKTNRGAGHYKVSLVHIGDGTMHLKGFFGNGKEGKITTIGRSATRPAAMGIFHPALLHVIGCPSILP